MTDDELNSRFLKLVEGGELDRILRTLRNQWDGIPRETVLNVVRDAATEAVRRHREGHVIRNLAGIITTIARRMLVKVWAAMEEAAEAKSAIELRAAYPEIWQHDEERVAKVKRAADYVRTLVPKLDNQNHRRTILTILDAAQHGEQMENKDLADKLGCSPDTAGKWKERAPKRLLPILKEAGFETLDDLLHRPVLPEHHDEESDDD